MPKYTKLFFLILLLTAQLKTKARDFNIIHTDIKLTEIDFGNSEISGVCELKIIAVSPYLKRLHLDLASTLTVDSVVATHPVIGHSHLNNELKIELLRGINRNNIIKVKIYYSGSPDKDPGGWGGFYFKDGYAFNLGVGFTVNPHPYGRAWFPTLDDFVTKSTYSFEITTQEKHKAVCNGHLIKTEDINKKKVWHYELKEPVCSYLVSVAVGNYVFVQDTVMGLNGINKIRFAAQANDTLNVKKSFVNLKNAFHAFEHWFGPHPFDLIGFTMVPFTGGAMEHATNIAYPVKSANGSLNRETLMAHELSHHWFGNYVTTQNQENMWINEAFASYAEKLFTEWVYGKEAFQKSIENTQAEVLRYAHLRDGSPLPVHGISHENTYGMHVYKKGAGVIHSLRGILGDSVFKLCIKTLMIEKAWQSINTSDIELIFSKVSGLNLSPFFSDWIYEKGFAHAEIIKWEIKDNKQIKVYTRQKPRFREQVYKDFRIELCLYDKDFKTEKHKLTLNKMLDTFSLNANITPDFLSLDCENKLFTASSHSQVLTDTTGIFDFKNAFAGAEIEIISGQTLISVEHHWNGPFNIPSGFDLPVVSTDRYWTVDGIFADDFLGDLILIYDGRTGEKLNPGEGYLDHNLIRVSEDSLVLLYRMSKNHVWETLPDVDYLIDDPHDMYGKIRVHGFQKGDYVLAIYDKGLIPNLINPYIPLLKSSPNPATSHIKFDLPPEPRGGILVITDVHGKILLEVQTYYSQFEYVLELNDFSPGNYYATYYATEGGMAKIRFSKE